MDYHIQFVLLALLIIVMFVYLGIVGLWALWLAYLTICGDHVERFIRVRQSRENWDDEEEEM